MICNLSRAYRSYESALAAKQGEPLGAHAFFCSSCAGWHVQANVVRDWAKEPLKAKPGRKTEAQRAAFGGTEADIAADD